jgi:hypothetical protein
MEKICNCKDYKENIAKNRWMHRMGLDTWNTI